MYKLLLCWRYLRTRYIALASIVSVTLGVATMIVVNSVMSGFAHEMHLRVKGILSDVVVETHSADGAPDAAFHMDRIRAEVGEYIEGMTPIAHTIALLTMEVNGQKVHRQVTLIGIDPATHGQASDFSKYLLHPGNRERMSFDLRDGGFDVRDRQGGEAGRERPDLKGAGWEHRRRVQNQRSLYAPPREKRTNSADVIEPPEGDESLGAETTANELAAEEAQEGKPDDDARHKDPFSIREVATPEFDPANETYAGIVLGMGLVNYPDQDGKERFLLLPGDDVQIALPRKGATPKPYDTICTVVDFYESKMSEYDSSFVFVSLEQLQWWRGIIDPESGAGFINSIQIKLKDGADAELVRDKLRAVFPSHFYSVQTWRDKQGPLLSAVQMETAILNVLLFLIVAVAGFGILAIFFMIVVEKTRDIGILKSLGASGWGVMSIFLGYGLSLGAVGAGAGLVLGLIFVANINEIADQLGKLTGQNIFDPAVYYFYRIPTIVEPLTVAWIVGGALAIAVMASVLPARRAAGLHPVEALRYE